MSSWPSSVNFNSGQNCLATNSDTTQIVENRWPNCEQQRMAITAKTVLVLGTLLHHLSCSALPSPGGRSFRQDQVDETFQGLEGTVHSHTVKSINHCIRLTGRYWCFQLLFMVWKPRHLFFCWVTDWLTDGFTRKNCCSFGFCPNYIPLIWTTCTTFFLTPKTSI